MHELRKSPTAACCPEETWLAAYAVRSSQSRGRRIPASAHLFRAPFQRDRDRIIHSRAFRRLEGKTQVFLSGSVDHFRTRLTHTIEVAAIARTLARRLHLNEDLAEAIALAHDLGHTPFGHMGERVLDAELRHTPLGGFDHNAQSLRVVDVLERKYPGLDGLNLSWEVRAGLVKHRTPTTTLDGVVIGEEVDLEAQAAHLADDIAYCTHDLDDGIESGLMCEADLAGVRLWQRARAAALAQGGEPAEPSFASFVVRCLIDLLVGDCLAESARQLAGVTDPHVARSGFRIRFSPAVAAQAAELRETLFKRLYRHVDVMAVNKRMGQMVRGLFRHFRRHPEAMGETARQRAAAGSGERAAADYIAGMTDRYARTLWNRLKKRG